jgi:hypothetical protein
MTGRLIKQVSVEIGYGVVNGVCHQPESGYLQLFINYRWQSDRNEENDEAALKYFKVRCQIHPKYQTPYPFHQAHPSVPVPQRNVSRSQLHLPISQYNGSLSQRNGSLSQ